MPYSLFDSRSWLICALPTQRIRHASISFRKPDAHLVAGVVANGLVAISGFVFRRIGIVPEPAVKKTLSFPDPKPLAKSPFSIAGLKHLGEAHGDRFSDESEDLFTFRIAAERQGGTVGFMVRSPFLPSF